MTNDPHAPPAGGADGRRPYTPPEKEYYRKPVDSASLPDHLGRLLDILLTLRWRAGESATIDPTTAELAVLYGCCKGHMRRLLKALASLYDGVVFVYPTPTYRLIRFDYKLKGHRDFDRKPGTSERGFTDRSASRERGRRAAGDDPPPQSTRPMSTPVTGGAPTLVTRGAPSLLLEEFEQENTTLTQRGLDLPRARETAVEPPSPPAESISDRWARLAAELPDTERVSIRATILAATPNLIHPNLRKMLESRILGEFEQAHPDRFPPIAAAAPSPPPPLPAAKRTFTERILGLTPESGREEILTLARDLALRLEDVQSVRYHEIRLGEVAKGSIPANFAAKVYRMAPEQTRKRPGVYVVSCFNSLRGGGKTARRASLESLPAGGSNHSPH